MTRKINILDSAKEEFKDIKKYVKSDFGGVVWNEVNSEYKNALKLIKNNPDIGSYIAELKDIGILNVRCKLVRQTKIVYEFDDDSVVIHMFISTKKDFRVHLLKRLFNLTV